MPLTIIPEIFLIVVGIAAFFHFKTYNGPRRIATHPFLLAATIVAAFSGSFAPYIMDHFGYYVPTIAWLRAAGLVKGIACLDLTLGQMSLWHILSAGISHFADPFLRININVFLLYALYAVEKRRFIHMIFLPVLVLFLQSPSPDLPVIVFSMILLDEFLSGSSNRSWLFAIASYIFAVKPTLLWPLILLFVYNFSPRNWKSLLPGAAILALFFAKNIWCFGYPVFPVASGGTGVPWEPNSQLMAHSAEVAVLKTYDMQYSINQIKDFTIWEHVYKWLTLAGVKAVINCAFVICIAGLIWYGFKSHSRNVKTLIFAVLVKSAVVLCTSAQYRFFLDVFFVAIFIFFAKKATSKRIVPISLAATLCSVGLLSAPNLIQSAVPTFRLGHFMKGFGTDQIYKPLEYEETKFKTYIVGNLTFHTPYRYPLCYKTPLPAISPDNINDYLQAGIFPQYSNTERTAFCWRRISESEKIQIRRILKEVGYTKPKSSPND